MMTGILTTARLVCMSKEARELAIEAFRKIIAYTAPNEPGVLQYVCALPVDDRLGLEIYMIEEYATQTANDAHLTIPPVKDLFALFKSGDVLGAPPEVHSCPIASKKTSGPPLSVSSNPAIILAHTEYRHGTASDTLEGWEKMAESALKGVTGFNKFVVTEDKASNSVRTECVLENWEQYETFLESGVTKAHQEGSQSIAKDVKVRAIAGFLGREEKSKL